MTDKPKNPPIATHRDGAVSAKVWRNVSREGEPFYSVTLQRTYTDPKTNEPRETNSFLGTDVLKAQHLAGEAYQTIQQERRRDKSDARAHEDQPSSKPAKAQQQLGLAEHRDVAFAQAAPRQARAEDDGYAEARQHSQTREPNRG